MGAGARGATSARVVRQVFSTEVAFELRPVGISEESHVTPWRHSRSPRAEPNEQERVWALGQKGQVPEDCGSPGVWSDFRILRGSSGCCVENRALGRNRETRERAREGQSRKQWEAGKDDGKGHHSEGRIVRIC